MTHADALRESMRQKLAGRASAKWRQAADVDWDDLFHFIGNCQRQQNRESFDTALTILEALKKQVLERE